MPRPQTSIICIGHRGAPAHAPENTLSSFQRAIDLGADWIELDVHLVESNLVVFHDYRLERMTDGAGRLESISLEQLRALKIAGTERVPLLEEVLTKFRQRTKFIIELKAFGSGEATADLLAALLRASSWTKDDFMVSSYIHSELKAAKLRLPDLKISPLVEGPPDDLAAGAERLGAYAVQIMFEMLNTAFVEDAHRRGVKVFTYTPNEPEEIRRCIELGVDGIISDYPERVLAASDRL